MQLRLTIYLLFVISILFLDCDYVKSILDPEPKPSSPLELEVNKTLIPSNGELRITLYNHSAEAVYLEGCNPIYWSQKTDTGWVDQVFRMCVWEGLAIKVSSGSSYKEICPATGFSGTIRFFAPVYRGCEPDKPISQAGCISMERIYSKPVQILTP